MNVPASIEVRGELLIVGALLVGWALGVLVGYQAAKRLD